MLFFLCHFRKDCNVCFINRFFKIMGTFYGRTISIYRTRENSRMFLLGCCGACHWCHVIKKKLTHVKMYFLITNCKCTICFACFLFSLMNRCPLSFQNYILLFKLYMQLYFSVVVMIMSSHHYLKNPCLFVISYCLSCFC
jgi:hypothetical protein